MIVYSICDRKSFQQAKRLVECVCRVKRVLKQQQHCATSSTASQQSARHSFPQSCHHKAVDNDDSSFHYSANTCSTSFVSECDRLRFLLRQVQQQDSQPQLAHRSTTTTTTTSGSSCCSSLVPSDEEDEQPSHIADRRNEIFHSQLTSDRSYDDRFVNCDHLSSSTVEETDCESTRLPLILLGNKRDLEHVRQVMLEDGQELALKFRCQFYEVSAAESFVGVRLAFQGLVREARASSLLLHDTSIATSLNSTMMITGPLSKNLPTGQSHPQQSNLESTGRYACNCGHNSIDSSCCCATNSGFKPHHLQINLRRKSSSTMTVSKMIGIVFGSKSARQKKRPSLSI